MKDLVIPGNFLEELNISPADMRIEFAVFLYERRVALPRVGGILENRETKIASDLEASREMQSKAQAAARANEESIRLRREEAQAIGRDAQQKIASEAAAQRTRAEAEAAEKIRAAEARISAAKAQALGNVEQIAVDAAASIIEKLSGVSVDRDRLVAEHRSVKSS